MAKLSKKETSSVATWILSLIGILLVSVSVLKYVDLTKEMHEIIKFISFLDGFTLVVAIITTLVYMMEERESVF